MMLCYLKRMNILLFEEYSLSSNFSKTKVVKILRQVKTSVSALLCSIFFYYNNNLDLKSKRFCFHYKSTIKLDEKLYANPASCDKAIINSAKKKKTHERNVQNSRSQGVRLWRHKLLKIYSEYKENFPESFIRNCC